MDFIQQKKAGEEKSLMIYYEREALDETINKKSPIKKMKDSNNIYEMKMESESKDKYWIMAPEGLDP